jgi:hypothetical protein
MNDSWQGGEMLKLFLVAFLCVSWGMSQPSPLWAWNEPDSFMGIKFWRPIGDSVPKCESDEPPYYPNRAPCWKDISSRLFMIKNIALVGSLFVDVVDNQVASVNTTFELSRYSDLAAIFKERYGQPTETASTNWQTTAGLTIPGQVMLWKGKKVSIALQERGGHSRIDQGSINVWTDLREQHVVKKNEEHLKKAAKGR